MTDVGSRFLSSISFVVAHPQPIDELYLWQASDGVHLEDVTIAVHEPRMLCRPVLAIHHLPHLEEQRGKHPGELVTPDVVPTGVFAWQEVHEPGCPVEILNLRDGEDLRFSIRPHGENLL